MSCRDLKAKLNGAGKAFCAQFAAISGKYPFNPNAKDEVPVAELDSIFAPRTGALWKFYEDAKLAQFLPKQGSRYVAVNEGTVKLFPAFVQFFNHAADISDGMYPSGSPPPRFTYTLKEMPSNVEGLTLKIGSETLSGPGQAKAFTWTGAPEDIQVTTKNGVILRHIHWRLVGF